MTERAGPTPGTWGAGLSFDEAARWAELYRPAHRQITDVLLEGAELRPGLRVLDEACGQGTPALAEAERVGPTGSVVGVDISLPAIELARRFAERDGVGNVRFQAGDAIDLPFPDGTFDRVTSRFGPMFFGDLERAAREAHRVMVPGGRVAWLVWGRPDRVDFFRATVEVVQRHAGLTALPEIARQVFRFAEGDLLRDTLRNAGFSAVELSDHRVPQVWNAPPETVADHFWEYPAPPFKAMISGLTSTARSSAVRETVEAFRAASRGGQVHLVAEVRLVRGTA